LDGDPTLGSSSPSRVMSGELEWPSSSKTWEEEEEEASFERSPYPTRKLEPFLIPSDQDDVSSIDRPLETSAWTPTALSSLHFDVEEDEGDPPPLNTTGDKEVTEIDETIHWNNKDKEKTIHQTDVKEQQKTVSVSPSPLNYKQKANPQHRRMLAKKILQYRKKVTATVNKGGNESSGSSGDSPSTLSCGKKNNLKSLEDGKSETREVPAFNLNTENDAATKSPESSDETVSWASTLTTDPSRLVTPSNFMLRRGQDDGSRQVPYLRMDTLPSVEESEELPAGKLDRHFLQQRSIASHSIKQKSSSTPLHGQSDHFTNEELPPNLGTLPSQPSSNETQPEVDSALRSAQPLINGTQPEAGSVGRSSQAYLDQRDDQTHSVRRTFSESKSEVSERYRRSAPDQKVVAQSDPGDDTSGLSPLAQAAAHWPLLPDQRVAPLINYGNTNDVLVTLHPGGEAFEHSSHILAYASPVLRQKLQPVLGGWYRLDLQQTTIVEWQLITPFLEPHSVQSAVVTPSNLSQLLPWFLQLQLDILLIECDQLLVTLEFPKAHNSKGTSVSAINKSGSGPQIKDMIDIILLTEIGCLGQLNGVREASLETLESYLALHPGLAVDSEALPLLMRLLKDYPPVRQRLWRRSLVRFLPSDLPIFNERKRSGEAELVVVETMVYNPLFPFLLREGLSKAAKEDEYERRTIDLEERWKRFRERQERVQQTSREYSAAMGRENSILDNTRVFMDECTDQSSAMGSLSFSRSESVNTSKLQQAGVNVSASPLTMISAMCDDGAPDNFADWWFQRSKTAMKTMESPKPKTSLQQSLASIRSRAESQRIKQEIDDITRSARSRTQWLELILKRLRTYQLQCVYVSLEHVT